MGWQEWEEAAPSVAARPWFPERTTRWPKPQKEKDSFLARRPPGRVRSDTVSADWLAQFWPRWKAERFVEHRARWQGMDSAISVKEGWLDMRWNWEYVPPETRALTSLDLESWYAHPLWRSVQIQAVHRYQSRIRPLRTWEEVFSLAAFDSVQQIWIPKYFRLKDP